MKVLVLSLSFSSQNYLVGLLRQYLFIFTVNLFLIRKNQLALCTYINILAFQKDFYYLPELHVNPILFHGSACLFNVY